MTTFGTITKREGKTHKQTGKIIKEGKRKVQSSFRPQQSARSLYGERAFTIGALLRNGNKMEDFPTVSDKSSSRSFFYIFRIFIDVRIDILLSK